MMDKDTFELKSENKIKQDMGIPEEVNGSARKRPRLSLRMTPKLNSSKKTLEYSTESTEQSTPVAQNGMLDSSGRCESLSAHLPSSPEPAVPPVASLYNLGNTCFLNSMLQVLRYTPSFLDGINKLQADIAAVEAKSETEGESGNSSNQRVSWLVVRNTWALYQEMEDRENHYKELATSDASSMAVRPSALLDNIRHLNPMFEGHFQHDAQELLRCLLCYIEDAEKELQQLKEKNTELKTPKIEDVSVGQKEHFLQTKTESKKSAHSLKGGESRGRGRPPLRSSGRGRSQDLAATNSRHAGSDQNNIMGGTDASCVGMSDTNNNSDVSENFKGSGNENPRFLTLKKERDGKEETGLVKYMQPVRGKKRKMSKSIANIIVSSNTGNTVYPTTVGDQEVRTATLSENNCNNALLNSGENEAEFVSDSDSEAECSPLSEFEIINQPAEISPAAVSLTGYTRCNYGTDEINHKRIKKAENLSPLKSKKNSATQKFTRNIVGSDNNNNNGDVNNNDVIIISGGESCNKTVSRKINRRSIRMAENSCLSSSSSESLTANTQDFSPSKKSELLRSQEKGPVISQDSIDEIFFFSEGVAKESPLVSTQVTQAASLLHTDDWSLEARKGLCSASTPSLIFDDDEADDFVAEIPLSFVESSGTPASMDSRPQPETDLSQKDDSTLVSTPPRFDDCCLEPQLDPIAEHSLIKNPVLRTRLSLYKSHLTDIEQLSDVLPVQTPVTLQERKLSLSPVYQVSTARRRLQLAQHLDLTLVTPKTAFVSSTTTLDLEKRKYDSLGVSPLKWFKDRQPEQTEAGHSFPVQRKILWNDDILQKKDTTPEDKLRIKCTFLKALARCYPQQIKKQSDVKSTDLNCDFKDKVEAAQISGKSKTSCRLSSQVRLQLQRCDWLGVSPSVSVSASKAMSLLDRCQNQRVKTLSETGKAVTEVSIDSKESQSNNVAERSSLLETQHSLLLETVATDSGTPVTSEARVKKKHRRWQQKNPSSVRKSTRLLQHTHKSRLDCHCCSLSANTNNHQAANMKAFTLKHLSVRLDKCDLVVNSELKTRRRKSHNKWPICGQADCTIKENFQTNNLHLLTTELRSFHAGASTLAERLFGGVLMHQTKCLECETVRPRLEAFMDVSIPVRSLPSTTENNNGGSSSDEGNGSCGIQGKKPGDSCLSKLMESFGGVERLRDTNKYLCDQCVHYVEAERSCHYVSMPGVLTLHLKRFSASLRSFGMVSKLTDKVAIPETLPCLQYQCRLQCVDPSHTYTLFGIVTHSGNSIQHGHYRSYVKVQSRFNHSVYQKLLKAKDRAENGSSLNSKVENTNIHLESNFTDPGYVAGPDDLVKLAETADYCDEKMTPVKVAGGKEAGSSGAACKVVSDMKLEAREDIWDNAGTCDQNDPGNFWLECDDECIKVMEESEFSDKLEDRRGSLIGTPYVLFYHRVQPI